MPRSISPTEIDKVNSCEAQWDFKYGGYLAGHTFSAKQIGPLLSQGKAWGQAVAVWHGGLGDTFECRADAHLVLADTFFQDVYSQRKAGFMISPGVVVEKLDYLAAMLDDYMERSDRLSGLTRLEHEYVTPIPSRSGKGNSNRWRFQGFIDGFVVDQNGHEWLVEFKLRTRLTPIAIIRRSRQIRFYAWCRAKETGRPVAGVIVDERLNERAKPARIVGPEGKRRPSEEVAQRTTERLYLEACATWGTEPAQKMVDALGAKEWGQRVAIPFRPSELVEAGRELVSAAQKIRELDMGHRYPLRNAKAMTCRFCDFDDICDHPRDDRYTQTLFDFSVPKRLRALEEGN
jgi:hypothetical protein